MTESEKKKRRVFGIPVRTLTIGLIVFGVVGALLMSYVFIRIQIDKRAARKAQNMLTSPVDADIGELKDYADTLKAQRPSVYMAFKDDIDNQMRILESRRASLLKPPEPPRTRCSSCPDAPVYNSACPEYPCGTLAQPCTHTVKCRSRAPSVPSTDPFPVYRRSAYSSMSSAGEASGSGV